MRMGNPSRYRPGREPSLRTQKARGIDSDDELLDSNTVEILGPAGNSKTRKNEYIVKPRPILVEGTDERSLDEARDPPDVATITRRRHQAKSSLPNQKTQKVPHRRSYYKDGVASASNSRNSAKLGRSRRRLASNHHEGGQDFGHGKVKVEGEPNLSPRAFRTASGQQTPDVDPSTSTSASSFFNSWLSWPFQNQIILIDLTTSREKISTNHETLDSEDQFCSLYDCGEVLGSVLPQNGVTREERAPRRTSASSQSLRKFSRTVSEIDELLDKHVDEPLTRLTDILDCVLDYISISMSHHVFATIKNSNKKHRLRESSPSTKSTAR